MSNKFVFESFLKEKIREEKTTKDCPTCGDTTLSTNKVCDGCYELYTKRSFLLDEEDKEFMKFFIL
jgi:hypothetical protein